MPPLYLVHPIGGNVLCYAELARRLGAEQTVLGLESPALYSKRPVHGTLEELATWHMAAIRAAQPRGPYRIAGWSLGGLIAFEIARQLRNSGQDVSLLALTDSVPRSLLLPANALDDLRVLSWLRGRIERAQVGSEMQQPLARGSAIETLTCMAASEPLPKDADRSQREQLWEAYLYHAQLYLTYEPGQYPGDMELFLATERAGAPSYEATAKFWQTRCTGEVHAHSVPGEHFTLLHYEDGQRAIAEVLTWVLRTPGHGG